MAFAVMGLSRFSSPMQFPLPPVLKEIALLVESDSFLLVVKRHFHLPL